MKKKRTTIWLVTYRYKGTNTIMGPIWEVPSKIKPTRWAQQAFEGEYDITYENTGESEQRDDENQDKQEKRGDQTHAQLI